MDAVSGWVFLFFNSYSFDANLLNLSSSTISKVKKMTRQISQLKYADSFGVDFHKTGFTQYISSLFMLKNKNDISCLAEGSRGATAENFDITEFSAGQYTLETSRSAIGPVSAYVALSTLGELGFQYVIGSLMEQAENTREVLSNDVDFILCNGDALGWCTMFMVNPYKHEMKFENILEDESSVDVDFINKYQIDFYNYLHSEEHFDGWFFSLSGRYKTRSFKFYPMSPFFTQDTYNEILSWIKENKNKFDEVYL